MVHYLFKQVPYPDDLLFQKPILLSHPFTLMFLRVHTRKILTELLLGKSLSRCYNHTTKEGSLLMFALGSEIFLLIHKIMLTIASSTLSINKQVRQMGLETKLLPSTAIIWLYILSCISQFIYTWIPFKKVKGTHRESLTIFSVVYFSLVCAYFGHHSF